MVAPPSSAGPIRFAHSASSSSLYSVLRKRRYPTGSHDRSSGFGSLSSVSATHHPTPASSKRSRAAAHESRRTSIAYDGPPAGNVARNESSNAPSYFIEGGHWNSTQPNRSPRSWPRATKSRTSSPTSSSFFQCVIRWFAFSVNTNPGAAFDFHFSTVFPVGKRRNV